MAGGQLGWDRTQLARTSRDPGQFRFSRDLTTPYQGGEVNYIGACCSSSAR
jgi:hypothetical protein